MFNCFVQSMHHVILLTRCDCLKGAVAQSAANHARKHMGEPPACSYQKVLDYFTCKTTHNNTLELWLYTRMFSICRALILVELN